MNTINTPTGRPYLSVLDTGDTVQIMTAPELLAREMPLVRMIEKQLSVYTYDSREEYMRVFDSSIAFYRMFGWSVSSRIG